METQFSLSHIQYHVMKRPGSFLIRPLSLLTLLMALSACANGPQVRVKPIGHLHYQAATLVQILYQKPIRSYYIIGYLSIQGVTGQSPAQLVAALQDKAAELGAEAIIIQESTTQRPPSLSYTPSGGQFTSSNAQPITSYQATAIRFTRD